MADDREARIDAMVAETEDLIRQVQDIVKKHKSMLDEVGHPGGMALQSLIDNPNTSPQCRDMIRKELANFNKALEEEDQNLLNEAGHSSTAGRPIGGSRI